VSKIVDFWGKELAKGKGALKELVIESVLDNKSLFKADLAGADLAGADLAGANLIRADLIRADLARADLAGANLTGANLAGADLTRANLAGADLARANLAGANLAWANLTRADLTRANLAGANLAWANLTWAYLIRANLTGANLAGAKGIQPEKCTPLLMLHDQPGKIRAYKLVNGNGEGPYNGGIRYKVGKSFEVDNADNDIGKQCAAGINVATLDWCLFEWREGYKVLIVEFTARDIAAIPTATDGKFRLHRCRIVGEKDVSDLVGSK
jgi:hypothetical protein